MQTLLVALADEGLMVSAHDLAEGGIAVALAECCFDSGTGVDVRIPARSGDPAESPADARWPDAFADVLALFGESASRVIVSAAPEQVDELLARARTADVPAAIIGRTGGDRVRLSIDDRLVIDEPRDELAQIWEHAIEDRFETSRTLV